MAARPKFLENERPFLKKLGIIRERPRHYDPKTHHEVWDWRNWKIDGDLLVNFDEVPFSVDYDSKQLVMGNERISMTRTALKRLQKYREGMLSTLCCDTTTWYTI